MQNGLYFIDGAVVSATDVRKHWTRIIEGISEAHKPAFVLTNNIPEAVVLSYADYQELKARLELAKAQLNHEKD